MENNASFQKRFTAARRAAIERDFLHLNDMQREAVLTTEGPLLLLAGAGSGKTTVLVNRIAGLIRYGAGSDSDFVPASATEAELARLEEYVKSGGTEPDEALTRLMRVEPAAPWRILAITFTNKAANELKTRLESMLGPDARDIWAMTFHAACVRILRRDIDRLGFDRGFAIYDTADSQSLMKRVLADLNLDEKVYPHRRILGYISKAKDELISPEDYSRQAQGDRRKENTGKAYAEYQRRLRESNALDFDDLLYLTVRLLEEYADVCGYYRRRFQYILIDEYQDTNNLQYRFAGALAAERGNICVVGDDDQSIYKFRGATIRNILSFEDTYKSARTIRLEQNYRSTGHILDAANAVIANNTGRKGKTLWTNREAGEKICHKISADERDEAQFVAGEILDGVAKGKKWSDYAVLYRMNALSNQLEYAFKRNGIPYRVYGGTRFFDRAEIKDQLAYLAVIHNPHDDLRLIRIINTPARGIGAKTIETAQEIAVREGLSLYQVLGRAGSFPALSRGAAKLGQLAELIDDLRADAAALPLDVFYDHLLDRTGYIRMLEGKDENIARIENIKELKSSIVNFMQAAEEAVPPAGTQDDPFLKDDAGDIRGGERTLAAFLEETALYTDLDQGAGDDCVVMMTLHSAKGLEFPVVFLIGAEEGIFPGHRAIGEQEEMEEERRLCYVGITRAERLLYLTCARQRMLFGRTEAKQPSRFIEEIPAAHIRQPMQPIRSAYTVPEREAPRVRAGISGGGQRKTPKPPKATTQAGAFQKGDQVKHKAFGRGMITSIQKMGGDALVEIAFDGTGTKRLMLNAAAQNMEKIS